MPLGTEQPRPPETNSGDSLTWLHYLLIFSAFSLVALVVISDKYQRRQARIEQQFHGIEEMQERERAAPRGDGAAAARGSEPSAAGDEGPLLISLRPLIALLVVLMLGAWGGLQWRRLKRRAAQREAAALAAAESEDGRP